MRMQDIRLLAAGLVLVAPLAVAAPVQAAARAACARVASDFNGDGSADIAATSPRTTLPGGQETAPGAVAVAYGPDASGSRQRLSASAWDEDDLAGPIVSGYFNDDCYADLAVGGRTVVILPGSATGLGTAGAVRIEKSTIPGGEAHTRFGAPLTTGDFNGDGRDDLAIAAPGRSIEEQGGEPQPEDDGGSVAVLTGSATGLVPAGWLTSPAIDPYDRLGLGLAAGDFDGDGFDDLAAGAPGRGELAGAVVVFRGDRTGLGTTGPVLFDQDSPGVPGTREYYDRFGSTLAAGDLTGDGRADLVVGSPGERVGTPYEAGSISVLKGSAAGLTGAGAVAFDQDTAQIPGTGESNDQFGSALAVGDLNGDGRPDIAVGTPGEDVGTVADTGSVTAVYSTATGPSAAGSRYLDQNSAGVPGSNEAGDGFGSALRILPGALVVGAPGEVTGSGETTYGGAFTVLTGGLSTGTFAGPAQFPGVVPGDQQLGGSLG